MNFRFFRRHGFCYELCDLFCNLCLFVTYVVLFSIYFVFLRLFFASDSPMFCFCVGMGCGAIFTSFLSVKGSLQVYLNAKRRGCLTYEFYKDVDDLMK